MLHLNRVANIKNTLWSINTLITDIEHCWEMEGRWACKMFLQYYIECIYINATGKKCAPSQNIIFLSDLTFLDIYWGGYIKKESRTLWLYGNTVNTNNGNGTTLTETTTYFIHKMRLQYFPFTNSWRFLEICGNLQQIWGQYGKQ